MTRWEGTKAELKARIKVPQPKAVWDVLNAPDEAPRANKYGNVPTVVDGIRFDSKAEATRYSELRLLERAGEIGSLECQPVFKLAGKARYVADFAYVEQGRQVVEDVKGGKATQTAVFKLKAKLFRERYPAIELRIVER